MSLLFIVTLEGKSATQKMQQVVAFTVTRAVATGFLGILAAMVGTWFLGFQKAIWIAVGLLYIAIGALYVTGRIAVLKRSLGPGLARITSSRGSVLLGA